jgi:hypothetical protein
MANFYEGVLKLVVNIKTSFLLSANYNPAPANEDMVIQPYSASSLSHGCLLKRVKPLSVVSAMAASAYRQPTLAKLLFLLSESATVWYVEVYGK